MFHLKIGSERERAIEEKADKKKIQTNDEMNSIRRRFLIQYIDVWIGLAENAIEHAHSAEVERNFVCARATQHFELYNVCPLVCQPNNNYCPRAYGMTSIGCFWSLSFFFHSTLNFSVLKRFTHDSLAAQHTTYSKFKWKTKFYLTQRTCLKLKIAIITCNLCVLANRFSFSFSIFCCVYWTRHYVSNK